MSRKGNRNSSINNNTELEAIYKLVEELKSDLHEKAIKKIDDLVTEIRQKDKKIEILESKVAVLENTVKLLSSKCDNNEQYSRRTSVRINNIPLPDDGNETAEEVFDKVKDLIEESEAEVAESFIDRAHRVGKPYVDQEGQRKQQVIVKFTTWYHRPLFYGARKKLSSAKVYLDLTQFKFNLLKNAQTKAKDINNVDFVFVDVNCALCVRLKSGTFKYFNTEEQFDKILEDAM